MALNDSRTGDLFNQFLNSDEGAGPLYNSFLNQRFGGPQSPQGRTFQNYFPNVYNSYLGQTVGGAPSVASAVGGPQFNSPDFLQFLRGFDFEDFFSSLSPYQRGENPTQFSPMVRRVS